MNSIKSYKLLIAGDIMPTPKNFDLFSGGNTEELFGTEIIKLFNDSDYSIANLEGALTDSDEKQIKSGPVIKAPTSTITAIKGLGLKACALANNHITDASQVGCLDTINTLEKNGLDYVGVGTELQMKRYLSVELGTTRVCIYNVSETFFNEPTDSTIGAHLYDEYIVCNEIKDLKKTFDYLIVVYHGGSEYFQYPTPVVQKRCHRMVDSGADIIVTQHTHCIGCEEYYNGSYILHGQGNFCLGVHKNAERQKLTNKGILLEISFSSEGVTINKHIVSLFENRYVRYDKDQDFCQFDERSRLVAEGKDFSKELQTCKLNEIALRYIGCYKGNRRIRMLFKRLFPSLYRRFIMKYTKRELLAILTTLKAERRNEEMKLIIEHMLKNN